MLHELLHMKAGKSTLSIPYTELSKTLYLTKELAQQNIPATFTECIDLDQIKPADEYYTIIERTGICSVTNVGFYTTRSK